MRHPSSTHRLALKNEAIIATLAQETDADEALVKSLYDEEIALLQAQASVKSFIGVIAARRVRQRSSPRTRGQRPSLARLCP